MATKARKKEPDRRPGLDLPTDVPVELAGKLIPSLWTFLHRRVRNHRLTYTHPRDPFRHRPFLQLVLDDLHPLVVLQKARQLGATEAGINQCLFLCCNFPGTTLIYTMPRLPQAQEFSSLRMDEAIVQSPDIRALCGGTSVSTKTFLAEGPESLRSVLLVKSSWEEALGESTATDVVVFDEYDRMREGVEDAFSMSLSSSRLGWTRFYSTPTIPGRGISRRYEESDKRRWTIRCAKCNEWQTLTWAENVLQVKGPPDLLERLRFDPGLELEPGSFLRICSKCREELDLMVCPGEWVSEHPSKTESHGYHVSQLSAPWLNADDLARRIRDQRTTAHWHNYVLGEPYLGEGTMSTETDVLQVVNHNLRASPGYRLDSWTRVGIGVDWGEVNWVSVVAIPSSTGKPAIVDVARLPAKGLGVECCNDILKFIEPYVADSVVADHGYGQDRNPYMAQRLGARFWTCLYPGGTRATMKPEWNPYRHEVFVGRTPALKNFFERLKTGFLHVAPLPEEKMRVLIRHLTALVPWRETRSLDGEVFEELVRIRDDHLTHATLYALLGLERSAMAQAQIAFIDLPGLPDPLGLPSGPGQAPPRGDELPSSRIRLDWL